MDLRKHVVRTPLLAHRSSESALEGRIFLKAESLQPFGSYKLRGVAAAVEAASSDLLTGGLSAASAGNMGQAVAFAAKAVGVPCRIFVPTTAPDMKKQAIRRLGAILEERPFDQIWAAVRGDVELTTGDLFIHPTRTTALLDGYGAIAIELLEDRPTLEAVVIPFGLGGLAMGLARVLKAKWPELAIFLAEPATAAPMAASLAAGHVVQVERRPSFIDAIGTPEVLAPVFEALQPVVAASLVVSIRDAEIAVTELFRRDRLIAEGAAACALAAGRQLALKGEHKEIAVILSGANLDETTLMDILSRHSVE